MTRLTYCGLLLAGLLLVASAPSEAVAQACGNGSCEATEDCSNCAIDCGGCPAVCGNFICEATESCSNCASDCGSCPTATPTATPTVTPTASPTPTPEPAVILQLVAGGVGLAFLNNRRMRKNERAKPTS